MCKPASGIFSATMSEQKQNTTNEIAEQLKATGDFLAITCQYPDALPQTFNLTLTNPNNNQQCLVSVLDTGVICFEPIDQVTDSDIVLSCAVHGNETAPIEICQQLVKDLVSGDLALKQRVLFLFANPSAINIDKRFVEENLNRLFSGAHSDGEGLINAERIRAKALEDYVRDFFDQGSQISGDRTRYHYDLHTAIRGSKYEKFAVYPFLNGKPRSKAQLEILASCGVSTILLSHSPTTTFSYYSANEFNAHAFTVELGQVKPFGQNDMDSFAACHQTLAQMISAEQLSVKEFDPKDFNIFEIYQTVNRENEDFFLHFSDDVKNFTDYPLDTLIATDGDKEFRTTRVGEAIIFPNAKVALGQRALLTVIPTSID